MFHPMTNSMWVTLLYFLASSITNHVSSHDQQGVSDTALFLFQEVSSIMFHPMTDSLWVTLLSFLVTVSTIIFHTITNREWVTLFCFFARQSHYLMTNSLWVALLHSFLRKSYQWCLIPWPTGCEWHCFISLPGSLTSIMYCSMTNRLWVLCSFLPHDLLPLILCSTVSQCYAIFANYFFSYHTQFVSENAFCFHQKIWIPWWPTASE